MEPYRVEDVRPMRDRILVMPLAAAVKVGSIYTPEAATGRDRPDYGIIEAKGPDVEGADIGDLVFFGKFSGQIQQIADRELINMGIREVYGYIPQTVDGRAAFGVVRHPEAWRTSHLAGVACDTCAAPDEAAAKLRMEQARREALGGAIVEKSDDLRDQIVADTFPRLVLPDGANYTGGEPTVIHELPEIPPGIAHTGDDDQT